VIKRDTWEERYAGLCPLGQVIGGNRTSVVAATEQSTLNDVQTALAHMSRGDVFRHGPGQTGFGHRVADVKRKTDLGHGDLVDQRLQVPDGGADVLRPGMILIQTYSGCRNLVNAQTGLWIVSIGSPAGVAVQTVAAAVARLPARNSRRDKCGAFLCKGSQDQKWC